MFHKVFFTFIIIGLVSLGADGLTGSGVAPTTPFETVSPTLASASAVTDAGVSAVFSEALLAPGATVPDNYAVSGDGVGTLTASSSGVSGGPAAFTLNWASGEMRDGVSLTLTVSGV